jgi:hypothetical protein
MPIHWGRIAWFASLSIAVLSAVWMRTVGYGWLIVLGCAMVIRVVSPFIISQVCAAFVLRRIDRGMRRADVLADQIAEAVKGLSPEEQEAVSKRIIDAEFK